MSKVGVSQLSCILADGHSDATEEEVVEFYGWELLVAFSKWNIERVPDGNLTLVLRNRRFEIPPAAFSR